MSKQLTIKCEPDGWFTSWVNDRKVLTSNQIDRVIYLIGWYRLQGYEVTYE